jgi:pimeloyl-ACP methyl ester carboxylesterase
MPEVVYNAARIFYNVSGSGDTLVLLHGFCEDQNIWELLIPPLAQQYKLILIDLPGFGKSEGLKDIPSVESYAESVSAVLKQEGISGCSMIGHSLGGYVTLAFAEKYPQMLYGIGLFHSQPYPDDDARKEARLKAKQFVKEVSSSRYVGELMGNLFSPEFKQQYPQSVSEIIKRYQATKPVGIIYALDAMRTRKDRTEMLKAFRKDVLYLVAEKDNVIPYQKSLAMAHLSPKSEVILLKNSSHMGMIEEPENALKAINTWAGELKTILK